MGFCLCDDGGVGARLFFAIREIRYVNDGVCLEVLEDMVKLLLIGK